MIMIYICPVGRDIEECKREVDLSIQRLFYWGAYADKYGGQVQVRSCDDHVTLLIQFSYEYQQVQVISCDFTNRIFL